MNSKENQDIQSQLLQWLQPFIFVLLVIGLVLAIQTKPSGSIERLAYVFLLSFMGVIDVIAFISTLQHHYRLSSFLTVILAFIGSWGSIYIDSRVGFTEFFPLIYVTVTVLFSSVLLPLFITITIASLQLVVLIVIIVNSPLLLTNNWSSFLAYVLITSVLSIVANYISSYQLKHFKENSIRDHLTGLLNRRYFDVSLDDKLQHGVPNGFTYGIMLMDIDNFKTYNDQYNHATGDIILQRVASYLSDALETYAIVCRHGGDEFAIIIPNSPSADVYAMAEKLRVGIKTVDITDICQTGVHLSLSIGLAMAPENGTTSDEVMAHADRNLMLAKELGKDRVGPQ